MEPASSSSGNHASASAVFTIKCSGAYRLENAAACTPARQSSQAALRVQEMMVHRMRMLLEPQQASGRVRW